jgi:hypothetical protein
VTATIMSTDLTGVSNEVKDIAASVDNRPGPMRIGGILPSRKKRSLTLPGDGDGVLIVYR